MDEHSGIKLPAQLDVLRRWPSDDAINDYRCGVNSSYHRTYHVEKSKFKDEDGTSMAETT
ncbi:hypothetical protein TUM4630_33890 [Shewanella algidipiscicola]|uniref:Uncharacterized protein n=1 Tax=Shewanella algidipiscicola TaxID=614070 RepID=A0ABQ4NSW4_9GAMM|nr:hypothetical protein TUM4630_33890 [Shewanella algidipiscicola]